MRFKFLTLFILLSFFNVPDVKALELGVGIRSMGQIVELGQKLGNSYNVRIAIGRDFEWGESQYASTEEIEVDSVLTGDIGQWSTAHASLLIDYHPWQGNFRMTLGLTDSSLSWSVENNDVDSFTFNGDTYDNNIVDYTELKVQFTDGVSPYIGIGWATAFDKEKGFSFNGDIGLLLASDFFVQFDANCVADQILTTECNEVKSSALEELQSLQSEEKINLLPLLGLSMSYKF